MKFNFFYMFSCMRFCCATNPVLQVDLKAEFDVDALIDLAVDLAAVDLAVVDLKDVDLKDVDLAAVDLKDVDLAAVILTVDVSVDVSGDDDAISVVLYEPSVINNDTASSPYYEEMVEKIF